MSNVLQNVLADQGRMKDLGWDVSDDGRMFAVRPDRPDLYLLFLLGGDDDGHPVRIEITYKERPRTRVFCFSRAVVTWPQDDVSTHVTTQARLWQLVEAYAPKKTS